MTIRKSISSNMTLKLIEEIISFLYPLVTSMYVLRTLGQQNIGEIKYVSSIISYFTMIAGLGIGTFATREGARIRDDKERFQKFSNEIFTISFVSSATALLLLGGFILIIVNVDSKANIPLYIISALPLAFSVISRSWINSVYEDFAYVTIRYILSSVIATALIFLFIREERDYLLYAFMLSAINCALSILNCIRVHRYSKIGFSSLHDSKPHWKPILLIFFSAIATKIYLNSDVTLLGALVSNEAVAVYSVASTVYSMVKQVSNSVVSVSIPRLSYYVGIKDEQNYRMLIDRLMDRLIIIILPAVAGLLELNRQILVILGGESYADGSATLCVLAIALPFAVIAFLLDAAVLMPFRQEKKFLFATVVSAVLNICLNLVFIPWLTYLGAAITTLIAEIVVCCILAFHSTKLTKIAIQASTVLTSLLGCAFIVLICETTKSLLKSDVICAIVAIIMSVFAYGLILIARRHPIVQDVKQVLHGFLKINHQRR